MTPGQRFIVGLGVLATVVSFIAMWQMDDQSHWNLVTAVWGAVLLGGIAWVVLEPRSGAVERRVWMSKHASPIRQVVQVMIDNAFFVALACASLPQGMHRDLDACLPSPAHPMAADRGLALIDRVDRSQPSRDWTPQQAERTAEYLKGFVNSITDAHSAYGWLLTPLTDLLEAVTHFEASTGLLIGSKSLANRSGLIYDSAGAIWGVHYASVKLCRSCWAVLLEIEKLH